MLEVAGLSKRFGERTALAEVSFAVRPGEVFGFVGANGAGKTTTMRIMLGVLRADAGTVRWQGTVIDARARRRIGYMPEERGLYPKMKVGEQLEYLAELHGLPRRDARRSVRDWIERLGVAERRDDSVHKLSLGNQQRVQLAAALVHDPDVLVLDEPFSGLDPVAVDVMSGVLREKAAAGVPVIFSSHQLELVERISERVGIIAAGRMVATGSVDELRSGGETVIDIRGPSSSGWAAALPGVTVLEHAGEHTRVRLGEDADDQQVLHAALRAGPVHEFSRHRPGLTELYRDVVRAPQRAETMPVTA
ncbi:MAG TPA: ATP-binding cassette domain-containing protein [Pseudonocardiaceae bacterium]|nr:ATP-binding cassette domain-containing protein [Pseudonocardiaceae bacterium]